MVARIQRVVAMRVAIDCRTVTHEGIGVQMNENLRRVARLGLLGIALLAVAGCSAAVDSDTPEGETVGSTQQAYSFAECSAQCESNYNDGYYQCQIGLGNWTCYMHIQNQLNVCLQSCPPCDYGGLAICNGWCASNVDQSAIGVCQADCHTDFCG